MSEELKKAPCETCGGSGVVWHNIAVPDVRPHSHPCPACQPESKPKEHTDVEAFVFVTRIALDADLTVLKNVGIIHKLLKQALTIIEQQNDALNQQVIEYESRGQYLYAGLGAPSSIRLVYDLLGRQKPSDISSNAKDARIEQLEKQLADAKDRYELAEIREREYRQISIEQTKEIAELKKASRGFYKGVE